MANSLVIRKGTSLAKREKALRAAQYVRMSTEYQRYSIQNQAAAIATFAAQRNLTIVRTYVDEARSGLRIKGRTGLIELIDDVRSGQADFDHILVYDVSRWGRFQDIDESAHYEFLCKQSGVRVSYCAEQFENDGSLLSSIIKNIKRVMAAEYSRELGVKVHAGQSRLASLGFRVGGALTFGLHREMVDEHRQSKGELTKGQHKAFKTDHVLLRPGTDAEAAIVKWIFHQFVIERKTDTAIARQLNRAGIPNQHGRPWSDTMIHRILKNENYVGNIVYNRTSRRLGQKVVKNPDHLWVRSKPVIDPIVDRSLFARAQKIMAERYLSLPEGDMLVRLRLLLKRKGHLSDRIIDDAPGVPCVQSYVKRFGSLRKAYALIGYAPQHDYGWIDSKGFWLDVLKDHAIKVAKALKKAKIAQTADACLTVNGKTKISFLIARHAKRRPTHSSEWRLCHKQKLSGLLVIIRLDDDNKAIEDYLLLPASSRMTGPFLRFSTTLLHGAAHVETLAELIANIKTKVRRGSRRT